MLWTGVLSGNMEIVIRNDPSSKRFVKSRLVARHDQLYTLSELFTYDKETLCERMPDSAKEFNQKRFSITSLGIIKASLSPGYSLNR